MRPENVVLSQSVVAFVDVLGTRVMGSSDPQELQRLLSAWARARDFASPEPGYELRTFTDNSVLRWPLYAAGASVASKSVAWVVDDLAAFQLAFSIDRLFVRGAVELGELAMGDGFVFGPGLLRSYRSESTAAFWPRIILSDDAVLLIAEAAAETAPDDDDLFESMLVDEDGRIFVHYLRWTLISGNPVFFLRRHRAAIVARLADGLHDPRASEKLRWLVDYHNFSVGSLGYGAFTSLYIDAEAHRVFDRI